MKEITLKLILLLLGLVTLSFSAISEKEMEKLYQNPPGVKKYKAGYVLYKPSVKKIGNKLYECKIAQVVSDASARLDVRIDCGNRKLAYGCGIMWDKNDKETMRTKSCASGTFEPFKVPKDKDWREVVKAFCERYDK
jgi:hypothetical protein